MSITLFKEITTDEALTRLEKEGEKYTGLYVDMDNAKERKYVKDSASLISDLIKRVDRARIDKAREFKVAVEAEAHSITARLEAANLPYSALIDAHKEKRAAILAAEKAEQEAQALLIKIEADHNEAIMLDRIRTIDLAEAAQREAEEDKRRAAEYEERAKIQAQAAIDKAESDRLEAIEREAVQAARAQQAEERAAAYKVEAEAKAKADAAAAIIRAQEQAQAAVQAEQDRIAEAARLEAKEQAKRDANKAHKASINRSILALLVEQSGITEAQAKKVITAIAKGLINNLSIRY